MPGPMQSCIMVAAWSKQPCHAQFVSSRALLEQQLASVVAGTLMTVLGPSWKRLLAEGAGHS